MMMMTAGVKYFGPVQPWRKARSWIQSVMLKFDSAQHVCFFEIRKALYQKFGREAIGGVQLRESNDSIMVIEVYIFDSQKRRQTIRNSMFCSSPPCLYIEGFHVSFKAWPALPRSQRFRVYKVQGLPFRSEAEICTELWLGVILRLKVLLISRGLLDAVPENHLVDIVPEHNMTETISVFNGTIYIVLQDANFGVQNYFNVYGTRVSAGISTLHHAYCSKCRGLDAHLPDDCPLLD